MQVDKPLLILAVLLGLVMTTFMLGWIPWPFGSLILVILMIARISHLKSRR